MIIASPAKKELAIQLQVLQTPTSPTTTSTSSSVVAAATSSTITTPNSPERVCFPHEYCSNPNAHQHQDVVTVSKRELGKPVQCQAFIHNDTVFLTCPVMDCLSNWADGEFQSCITHLIELAEEKTGCEYLVIAIDRRHLDNNTVLKAFMYLGFQMIEPSVYGQELGYVLVGYEL
ncbi:hypothetical protein BDB00DRAFT_787013 [Zychaea mexicana]|uniref:uncharacterized protein n=1 Tax=Zychaea mexicana TaxID=64656 RepID=UPI0022FECF97|nr:uncharacterized protein BDB00DRAFT_787013 [Zychaea mexicana]KAI9494660.1 hypothetical protein BDB00DRAFT_787013 [Zychaea mexicana]